MMKAQEGNDGGGLSLTARHPRERDQTYTHPREVSR